MGSDEHVCPVCGQPVETVVRRHKTLGAWVPVWVPGPCRNPECEAYDDQDAKAVKADKAAKAAEEAGAARADRTGTADEESGKSAAKNS
ncbi:hypothetical protein GCM10027074_25740 [Streptomyces deserti]